MRLFSLLFLAACGSTPAVPAPAPAAPTEHGHHDAGAHTHNAKHGGDVKMVGDLHVEAVFSPEGVLVWLADKDEKTLDPTPYAGSAVVSGPGGASSTAMMVMGESLHAPVALEMGKPASAVITLTVGGQPQSLSFETPAVGLAAHDHTSLHGGTVAMWGDYHIEYAPAAGEYRFYITGATRAVLNTTVTGTVTDAGAELPLAYDAATGLLSAKAEGAGSRPVKLNLSIDGHSFSYPFDPRG